MWSGHDSSDDDLFQSLHPKTVAPLAHRLRPRKLDDWIGHERVFGQKGVVRAWLESARSGMSKRFPSILLWGPPGVGKTSLAILIAESLGEAFIQLSAVSSGVKDIKEAADRAKSFQASGRNTILFLDEIHRLNKTQQDSLLPFVESGLFILIGATTENPSFEVNAALLSRMRVIRLERLTTDDLLRVLDHALISDEGLSQRLILSLEAKIALIEQSEGDARRLLTLVESIALMIPELEKASADEPCSLDQEKVNEMLKTLGDRVLPYDQASEDHHNTISAFIKSMRASDPQAAVYYLARMLTAGEDPLFIARRMIVFASEDVGNADPRALLIAVAAKDALECVGLPEARINLAHAAISLALAKKDRAIYEAIQSAMNEVQRTGALPIPMVLRNAVTPLMKAQGYGKGDPEVRLPQGIGEKVFFRPRSS